MAKDFDYKAAKQELEELLDWFESAEPDLDKALEKHKRAEGIINDIEKYLKNVEENIKIDIKNKI